VFLSAVFLWCALDHSGCHPLLVLLFLLVSAVLELSCLQGPRFPRSLRPLVVFPGSHGLEELLVVTPPSSVVLSVVSSPPPPPLSLTTGSRVATPTANLLGVVLMTSSAAAMKSISEMLVATCASIMKYSKT